MIFLFIRSLLQLMNITTVTPIILKVNTAVSACFAKVRSQANAYHLVSSYIKAYILVLAFLMENFYYIIIA